MAFDDFFKNLLKDLFGSAIESGISIGTLEKRIDLVIHGYEPIIQQSNLLPYLKKSPIHIIEYKSHRDTYTLKDLTKLLGYGAFYAENKGLSPNQFQTDIALWFITTVGSAELKDYLKLSCIQSTNYPGVYQMNWSNLFYIVIINELEISEQTSIFLMNSSGAKLSAYLQAIIHKQIPFAPSLHKYLRSKLLLDYSSVENMTEVSEFFALDVKENLRAAVKDIGLVKVIDAIGIDKAIEAVGIEKVIETVGIEKVIETVGIEKIEKIIDKMKKRNQK
jgi:hypothetical protein